MRTRRTLVAILPLSLLLLTACVPTEQATPSASATPSSSASGSATPSATPTASSAPSTPVTIGCDSLISLQEMYDFNPNFSAKADYSPAARLMRGRVYPWSHACAAASKRGACPRWWARSAHCRSAGRSTAPTNASGSIGSGGRPRIHPATRPSTRSRGTPVDRSELSVASPRRLASRRPSWSTTSGTCHQRGTCRRPIRRRRRGQLRRRLLRRVRHHRFGGQR